MDFIIDGNAYNPFTGKTVKIKKEDYDKLILWLIDVAYSEGYVQLD